MDIKALNLLGIATRAGKVAAGFSRCRDSVKSGKAALVLVCADISAKTEKELNFECSKSGVSVIRTDCRSSALSAAIGFKCGVCAVLDEGFAAGLTKLINRNERIDTDL